MKKFSKDPDSLLDYAVNWSPNDLDAPEGPWLVDGDTIVASSWIVPTGLTKTDESHTDTVTTIWLSGGTLGEKHLVTNRITTTQGRTEDRTVQFVIEEH